MSTGRSAGGDFGPVGWFHWVTGTKPGPVVGRWAGASPPVRPVYGGAVRCGFCGADAMRVPLSPGSRPGADGGEDAGGGRRDAQSADVGGLQDPDLVERRVDHGKDGRLVEDELLKGSRGNRIALQPIIDMFGGLLALAHHEGRRH